MEDHKEDCECCKSEPSLEDEREIKPVSGLGRVRGLMPMSPKVLQMWNEFLRREENAAKEKKPLGWKAAKKSARKRAHASRKLNQRRAKNK